jgi:hypothetical protein
MPPNPTVPAGTDALELHIDKARLGEPLQQEGAGIRDKQHGWGGHEACDFNNGKPYTLPPQVPSNQDATHSPARMRTSKYCSSVGKSIQESAKNLLTGCVGWTGPMTQARPPSLITRYASQMPRCGSGQYSMLPAETYLSNASLSKGRSSASPCGSNRGACPHIRAV